uniref:Cytokine n=1 Tax=Lucilia cuprina TaxID=7375 RepID=B6ZDS7_LUCCU|nr:cytokine [Lucilia cuprina]
MCKIILFFVIINTVSKPYDCQFYKNLATERSFGPSNGFQHDLAFHHRINNLPKNLQPQRPMTPPKSVVPSAPINNNNNVNISSDNEAVNISLRTILSAPSNCQQTDFKGRCL